MIQSPVIAIIGCGYVGLTTAVCFAELGYRVIGIENNALKFAGLCAGAPLFDEPETTAILQKHLKTGNLTFSDTVANANPALDVVFLAVQTTHGDMSILKSAAQEAAAVMPKGGVLVVRSTAAPGTGDEIARIAAEFGISVVSNPEFLRQGYGVADFKSQRRVIVGADLQDKHAESVMRGLYDNLIKQGCEYCAVTREEAELTKLMTNAYLANRVSLVNTFADICRAADNANPDTVISLLGGDSRIGGKYLNFGIGFGGSCLPKDTRLLARFAEQRGADAHILNAALDGNTQRVEAITADIMSKCAGRDVITFWGATFKPQSDDLRDSQAAKIIDAVLLLGLHSVRVWEPNCPAERVAKRFPNADICADESLSDSSAVIVLMPHSCFSASLADLPEYYLILDYTK